MGDQQGQELIRQNLVNEGVRDRNYVGDDNHDDLGGGQHGVQLEQGEQENRREMAAHVLAPQAAFIHDIDVHIKINCKTITEVVVPVVLVLGVLIVSVTYSGSWAATQTHVKSTSLRYNDCNDAFNQGQTHSGVYRIKPDHLPAFDVYCDMETDGGGWVVFQRRMDGTVDFYCNWTDYVKGFGDLSGEFWLGLNKIHRLTHKTNILKVDLEDFEGVTKHAIYDSFKVLDSSQGYVIRVSGYRELPGAAGDNLKHHSGMKFTTKDNDNDKDAKHNCANLHKGAWWYKACHESNLNGQYLSGDHSSYADGVNWKDWFPEEDRGHRYSLKTTEMKLRPN